MKKTALVIAMLVLGFAGLRSQGEDIIHEAMQKEMSRTMTQLGEQKLPPYYIAYFLNESNTSTIRASFGKLYVNSVDRDRKLDIDLRVGNYKFDNTHIIRGNPFSFGSAVGKIDLPIENDEPALRNAVWFATDKIYKSAIEQYEKALTNQAVKVAEEDTSSDFSKENPVRYIKEWKKMIIGEQPIFSEISEIHVDTAAWAGVARRLSAKFLQYDWILEGNIYITFELNNKMIINSEGTDLKFSEQGVRLFISMASKADDGMTLPLFQSYFGFVQQELPSEEELSKKIDEMAALLKKLRVAPMAETFSGPAILSGEASGVFFHEIFGHRVEGHREKDPNSSQTFKQSIGKKILPDFINVIFDPTIGKIGRKSLAGFYVFDDEGVKGQRVVTVKNGIFSNFLMSRIPIENFPNSNGHGRKQVGYKAVSRQSNLIVEATKKESYADLKKQLVAEAKKQNKEYGLYFEKVSGGFTFTSRTIPNSFNVMPIIVYKIYVDGRPDELVRGVDLIGTPLTTFANVVAAADDMGIFNGVCGAESGGVPVSASSPSLLVSTIEVQKKKKSQAKPPILESPKYESISQ